GSSDSDPGSNPMRSWIASCITPSGLIQALTICENKQYWISRKVVGGGWWPPPAPSLAPRDNIGGPGRQYRVAFNPSNTHSRQRSRRTAGYHSPLLLSVRFSGSSEVKCTTMLQPLDVYRSRIRPGS